MQRGRAYSRNIVDDLILEEHAVWSTFGVMATTPDSSLGASLTAIAQGRIVSRVHAFFNELQPGKCCTRLKPQRRTDYIRLVQDQQKYPGSCLYPSMDLSSPVLLDADASLYKHVYACAQWPVLSSSDASSPSPSATLSPTGEAGSRHEAVTAESLVKHMRNVFAFPVSITAKLEKEVRSRPHAKALVDELVNQLAALEQNRHPIYLPSSFPTRVGYELWQKTQRRRIKGLIAKFWHQSLPTPNSGNVEFPLKDRNEEYRSLVRRLLRYEAHCRRMEGTDDSVMPHVMFTASSRILREYALRYGIGDVYRHVALISTLAELFDCSLSFLSCTSLALGELLNAMPSNQPLVTRAENELLCEHLEAIRENCANFIVHMKDRFPENKPDGGVALLIRLTSQLREVDAMIRKAESCSIADDLQSCVKRGLQIIYEKHKAAAAERLGIVKAQRTLSPDLLYEMLIYITDEVSDYQANFHKEFSSYFDIRHVAALELYRYLMDDVMLLNEQATPRCDGSTVDVLMLGLAYRLSSLDKDWAAYIPQSEQRWREDFRRIHVPCWITAVKQRLEMFIQEACEVDDFKAIDASFRQVPVAKKPIMPQITPSPSSPFTPYTGVSNPGSSRRLPDEATEPQPLPRLSEVSSVHATSQLPGKIRGGGFVTLTPVRNQRPRNSRATSRADRHFVAIRTVDAEPPASERGSRALSASSTLTVTLDDEPENAPQDARLLLPPNGSFPSDVCCPKQPEDRIPPSSLRPLFAALEVHLNVGSDAVNSDANDTGGIADNTPSISAESSAPSSGRPSFGSLVITHAIPNDATSHDNGGLLSEPLMLPETGAAGPLMSSCLIDLIVMALRLEGFVRTIVEKICTPPAAVVSLDAALPCTHPGVGAVSAFCQSLSPSSPSVTSTSVPQSVADGLDAKQASGSSALSVGDDDRNVVDLSEGLHFRAAPAASDGVFCLARQVLCDLFVLLSERLLCIDVDNTPEAVVDKCIPVAILARLRKLEQFHSPPRTKTSVNEELWLQQLEQTVNSKMCLRINDVLLLSHLLSYFYHRLFGRPSLSRTDTSSSSAVDGNNTEFVRIRCCDQLLAIRDAQVALLARQIYYVLILPSRTAQIIRQLEELAKLKESALEAKMRSTVQCSFEASLKSAVAFLEHYLYPSVALEVLSRLWPLLREHFELQLADLPFYGDCERKAVVLLMMLSCTIRLLTRSQGCASLSLENLLNDCDPIIFRLDLYSISSLDLTSLYQELVTQESRSYSLDSSSSEDPLAQANRNYVENMRKSLHSLKKCFSGEELLLYVIAHPPNSDIARVRTWSGSSSVTMAPASGRNDQRESAQEGAAVAPEQLTEDEALRICDYLLHTCTIVCVDTVVGGYDADYRPTASDRSSTPSLRGAGSTAELDDSQLWVHTDDVSSTVNSGSTTPRQSPSPASGSGASRRTASTSSLSSAVDPEAMIPKTDCDSVDSHDHPLDGSSDNASHFRLAGNNEIQQATAPPQDDATLLQPSPTDTDEANTHDGACDLNHNLGGSRRYVKKSSTSSNPDSERSMGTESVSSLCMHSDYCFASMLAQYYVGRGRSNSNNESVREYVQRGLRTRRLAEQCATYRVHASDVAAVLTARSRLLR